MNWRKNGNIEYVLLPSDCSKFGGETIDPTIIEVTCTNGGKDFNLTFREVRRDQDGEKWSCGVNNPETVSTEVTIRITGRIIALIE